MGWGLLSAAGEAWFGFAFFGARVAGTLGISAVCWASRACVRSWEDLIVRRYFKGNFLSFFFWKGD